jgi:hypothetical protein
LLKSAAVTVLILLGACGKGTKFPFESMLWVNDLPPGWHYDDGEIVQIPDADARLRGFLFEGQRIGLTVKHILAVYEDEATAKAAFADWESEWFPTSDWNTPPDAQVTPYDHQDQYRLGCLTVHLDGQPARSCVALQQHRTFVSLLLANIDTQTITLSQFEHAIEAVDKRLNAAGADSE